MCVYNVLYISIGIYKISTAKRSKDTERIHTQPTQEAEQYHKEEREHRQEKQGHSNTQHNTTLTIESL